MSDTTTNPFDLAADRYDAWFESEEGRPLFALELRCLKELLGPLTGRWLEVGVGTGRFAQALGIQEGIDPSGAVLRYAAQRGIRTQVGTAEALPYPKESFDGVLMVVTICFVSDPQQAVRESARVLRPGGRLVVGLVPAESPWGRLYREKARSGHLFYSHARFYTCRQVIEWAQAAGLTLQTARSCLFTPPGQPVEENRFEDGALEHAGFVAIAFGKVSK